VILDGLRRRPHYFDGRFPMDRSDPYQDMSASASRHGPREQRRHYLGTQVRSFALARATVGSSRESPDPR
jgi:hypothetical protein